MMKDFFIKNIKLINWYPPYLGAGIKVLEVNKEQNRFTVALLKRFYNKNMFGTAFGGSLYAMSDPFYVFAAYKYFGDDYIIWDKKASIEFLKPGKETVIGIFEIPLERLARMKQTVDQQGKSDFDFTGEIKSKSGHLVAKVHKTIYIRKKNLPKR